MWEFKSGYVNLYMYYRIYIFVNTYILSNWLHYRIRDIESKTHNQRNITVYIYFFLFSWKFLRIDFHHHYIFFFFHCLLIWSPILPFLMRIKFYRMLTTRIYFNINTIYIYTYIFMYVYIFLTIWNFIDPQPHRHISRRTLSLLSNDIILRLPTIIKLSSYDI